ncbi:hypothetical protein [Trinickia symbiotica]|uniref:Uncharacterized protein n=1 Tax=Trinickia symbiotica TaxID=863227 RepID=A0A2N7X9P2_9BURK|nr:hypothetical protein [Trinickia symbiotica]PMS38476.1 hypothetical protein C0Z20_00905 [Trinickia symbiotica]
MNGWMAAAMAAGQTAQAIFSGPELPQVSSSQPFNPFTVDNSGWSIAFGNGNANATANPVSTLAQGLANGGSGSGLLGLLGDPLVWLMALAAFVVVRK